MNKLEQYFRRSRPVVFLLKKSKTISPPGFEGFSLYSVVSVFMRQQKKIGLTDRAAAISFNFIMAIPAATIFLFTLVPYLPINEFISELYKVVKNIIPNQETQQFIINFLDDFFYKPKTGLLSVGFILAVFYSSNAMMRIIRTFDRSFEKTEKGGVLTKRLRAIKLTAIVILLILATTIISSGQGPVFRFLMETFKVYDIRVHHWIQALRWVVVIILFIYAYGIIYKYAPSVKNRWKLLSPGAIFATIFTLLTTSLFSLWVEHFGNYNKVYGSIGTVLIIMMLIFINSQILLIGFELNVSIYLLKAKRAMRAKKKDRK